MQRNIAECVLGTRRRRHQDGLSAATEDGTVVASAREAGANLGRRGELGLKAPQRDGGRPGRRAFTISDLSGALPASIAPRIRASCAGSWTDRIQGNDPHRQRRAHRPAGGHRRRPWHRSRLGLGSIAPGRNARSGPREPAAAMCSATRQRLDRPHGAAGVRHSDGRSRETSLTPDCSNTSLTHPRTDSPRLSAALAQRLNATMAPTCSSPRRRGFRRAGSSSRRELYCSGRMEAAGDGRESFFVLAGGMFHAVPGCATS